MKTIQAISRYSLVYPEDRENAIRQALHDAVSLIIKDKLYTIVGEHQYDEDNTDVMEIRLKISIEEPLTPILPTIHHCPTLDEYRSIYAHYEAKGLVFTPTSVPIAKVNYIKQEGYFFTRISEQEFNELNNGSDEQI